MLNPKLRLSYQSLVANPMTIEDGAVADTEQKTSNGEQTNTSQVARELHWLERLNIFGQMGLVIVGIVAASIYGCQLHEMKRTNDLTQEALNGSNESLAKTLSKMQGQVDATNTLAGHAKDQADNAAVLATNSGIQAKASQEFADASQRNANIAKDAMQATIDSFHNEDRAWVGISESKPLSFTPNASARSAGMLVAFTLRNYGHSTGENIRFLAVLESDPTIISLPCDEVAKIHAGDVLLPTQQHTLNWSMNLTSDQITKGWSHQNPKLGNILSLRIVGCIEYTDREGENPPHRTPFNFIVMRKGGYITLDTPLTGDDLALDSMFESVGSSQVH